MKLFTKYNRINIIASITVFLLGCIAFYFVMDHILVKQLDESLETEEAEIIEYAKHYGRFPEIMNTHDQQVYFEETNKAVSTAYTTKKIWNAHEQVNERTRQLVFGTSLNNKLYCITVNRSQEQKEDLLKLIVLIATIMVALILIVGYAINRTVLKRLWQPFHQSIKSISSYQLQQEQTLHLPSTNIEEFSLLNATLNSMTAKAAQDYKALKDFTGNASHEMQTPLAIISNNTEILMQDEAMLEKHHASISTINDATKRLSRLNQSLLLLTKIENHRFELTETVQWDLLVTQRLNELTELTSSQNLSVTVNAAPVTTVFHQQLAGILVSNLLGNAIRYNYENGKVHVELNNQGLSISNTSSLPALDNEKVFSRFYRHPATKIEGNGLGLSIVHQLCKLAGYGLKYAYSKSGEHVFSIRFS